MSGRKLAGESTSPWMPSLSTKVSMLVTTALILIGLAALYVETYNMAQPSLPGFPGDAFFPRVILIFSVVWAVIILLRGLLLPEEAATADDGEARSFSLHLPEFASVIVLVVLYALLVEPVGFEITTVVFMMVLLVPRLAAAPGIKPTKALLQGLALSLTAMLVLYAGLGPALKIGLPLMFLPTYLL